MNDDQNMTQAPAKGGSVQLLLTMLVLMVAAGFIGWFSARLSVDPRHDAGGEKPSQTRRASTEAPEKASVEKTDPAMAQEIERDRKFEGKYWLELSKNQSRQGNHFTAAMMAGKSIGFVGLGLDEECDEHPALLKPEHGHAHEEAMILAKREWLKSPELVWRTSNSSHHGQGKIDLAYSPDGKMLASVGENESEIQLWNTETGDAFPETPKTGRLEDSLRHSADGNQYVYPLSCPTFSADGKFLAYYNKVYREVHLHDLALHETKVLRFPGVIEKVEGARFHPVKPYMLIHDEDSILFWDYLDGKAIGDVHQEPEDRVTSAYFDREGKRVVVCHAVKNAEVWNFKDGHLSEPIEIDPTKIKSAKVTVQKPRKYDDKQERWVQIPEAELAESTGWASPRHCIFPQDGIMATQFLNHPWIDFWDLSNGEALNQSYEAKPWFLRAIAINRPGNLWVGQARGKGINSRLLLHRMNDDRKDFEVIAANVPHVSDFEFSPDGKRLAVGSIDGVIRFLDVDTKKWVVDFPKQEAKGFLKDVCFSKDGSSVIAHFQNGVWLIDPANGSYLKKNDDPNKQNEVPVKDAGPADMSQKVDPFKQDGLEVALPDGSILLTASSNSSEVVLRDTATLKQIGEPMVTGEFTVAGDHIMDIVAMDVSPNGKWLALGHRNHSVTLWDLESRRRMGEPLSAHTSRLAGLKFSADGRFLVVGSQDGTISLWHLKHLTTGLVNNGLSIRPLYSGTGEAKVLAVSKTLNLFATIDKDAKEVQLWDVRSGSKLGIPIARHEDGKISCAFIYPDARYLAVGSGAKITFWDINTGLRAGNGITQNRDGIVGMTYCDNGDFLMSWSRDLLHAWDMENQGRSQVWDSKGYKSISTLAADPKSRTFAIGNYGITYFGLCADMLKDKMFKGVQHNKLMYPYGMEFSGDGQVLMVTYGSHEDNQPENIHLRKLHRYDAKTMEPIGDEIWTDGHCILHSTISPDHAWIATSSCDGKLRIWDTRSGDLMACHLIGFTGALKFSTDSKNVFALVGGRVDPEAGPDEEGLCKDFKSWNGCVERIVECDLRALSLGSASETTDLARHVQSGNFMLSESGMVPISPAWRSLYKTGNEGAAVELPSGTILKSSPEDLRKVMSLLRQAQNWRGFTDLYLERGKELEDHERFNVVQFLIALAAMESTKPSSAHADHVFGILQPLVPHEMVKTGKLDLALLGLCRDVVKIKDKKRADVYWSQLLPVLMHMEAEARDRCLRVIQEAEQ